jgi:hypothetical protein
MDTHKRWKRDVRGMNYSVAAASGAMAPVWIIKYAGAAYRDRKISLVEREEMLADARYMLTGDKA